ncbi:MAG: hypothetical protein EOP21_07745 [Hyphomicrobiales bacterium]|nr:MAG: hypothetical protein EOP21_07745 [Hyphomicrobiales bacterium]
MSVEAVSHESQTRAANGLHVPLIESRVARYDDSLTPSMARSTVFDTSMTWLSESLEMQGPDDNKKSPVKSGRKRAGSPEPKIFMLPIP